MGNVTLSSLTWYIQDWTDSLPFIILNYPLAIFTYGESPLAIVTKGLDSNSKETYTLRYFSSKHSSFYHSMLMILFYTIIVLALKYYIPWKIIRNKLGI